MSQEFERNEVASINVGLGIESHDDNSLAPAQSLDPNFTAPYESEGNSQLALHTFSFPPKEASVQSLKERDLSKDIRIELTKENLAFNRNLVSDSNCIATGIAKFIHDRLGSTKLVSGEPQDSNLADLPEYLRNPTDVFNNNILKSNLTGTYSFCREDLILPITVSINGHDENFSIKGEDLIFYALDQEKADYRGEFGTLTIIQPDKERSLTIGIGNGKFEIQKPVGNYSDEAKENSRLLAIFREVAKELYGRSKEA